MGFLKGFLFLLNCLILSCSFFKGLSSNQLEQLDTFPDSSLKITLRNKDYISSTRLGVLLDSPVNLKSDFKEQAFQVLSTSLPAKGNHLSLYLKGSIKIFNFSYSINGTNICYIHKNIINRISKYTRHVVVDFFKQDDDLTSFPLFSTRHIDNEGLVDSLKLLASRAINKFKGIKITNVQIKNLLPLDLQEYIQEND